MKYKTVEELLQFIEQPLRSLIVEKYHEEKQHYMAAQGSVHNHQAWPGGYMDHLTEVLNIGRLLYHPMNERRVLPFSVSDVLVVLFLHDIEKCYPARIQRYVALGQTRPDAKDRVRFQLMHAEYHRVQCALKDVHKEALRCVEGEKEEYTNTERKMSPLAAFCHMCDVASARIWFDHPADLEESWGWRESTTPGDHQLWGV